MRREFANAGLGFVHLFQDVQTAFLGLRQSLLHDRGSDACDLDVHLQRGDARFGARDLEVHVAEVIFVPEDVRQDRELTVVFHDQTHGDTGNGGLQRNARVHHGERATTDRGHRGGTVRFRDLRHDTDRVGEIGPGRQHRLQGTPCQLTVADLATTRTADATDFANRIGREVIMQHEVRFEVAVQRVDELFVIAGAERRDDQTLGFPTGEQGRAMGPRQQPGFHGDRTHLIQRATVDPLAFLHDRAAQDRGFELLQRGAEVGILKLLFAESVLDGILGGRNRGDALLLVGDRIGGAHLVFARSFDRIEQRRVIRWRKVERLFRRGFCKRDDQIDNRLDLIVREVHRAEHLGFGQLVGFGFHHHHGVFGARDDQVEPLLGIVAQSLHVIDTGVQHVVAIDETDTATGDRTHEGRAGNRQGSRGGDHRDHIGIVDQIVAEHGAHHQNFVLEARDEQRADRTVDQACGQRFLFGRPRFALEETTGDLARGVVFFLVVNGQGKEILTGLRCLGKGHVRHDTGFTQRRDHGAISLTGNLARFQSEGFIAPLHRLGCYVEHHRIL